MEEVIKLVFELLFKNPLYIIFIIFILFISIYYKKIIGAAGEYWVNKELLKLNKDYKIINDVMIRTSDGRTHQIDHIVISKYGIFVIETKQYNGYIIGNDYDKKWTIKAGNKKYYVNNPVHQNYGHIQSLKEVLNIDDDKFISIVCISSRAKVNVKSDIVVTINDFLPKINSYTDEIISNVDDIYLSILNKNIKDKIDRKQHVKEINIIKKEQNIKSINKCPKCGGNLIERSGKYGKFIGCSNYPKCNFTKGK